MKKDLMNVTVKEIEKIAASDAKGRGAKMVAIAMCDVAFEVLVHIAASAVMNKKGGDKGHNRK